MPSFTDRNGKTWSFELDLAIARRIDNSDYTDVSDVKISMLRPTDQMIQELLLNPALCAAIAYTAISPKELEVLGDSEEERQEHFAALLDGAALERTQEAVWDAFSDFTPRRKTALSTLRTQLIKNQEMLEKKMEALSPRISERVLELLEENAEKLIKEQLDDTGMDS